MPRNVIADSSALVALVRRDDQHHRWLNSHIDTLPVPWRTCEAALSETFHLIGERGVPKIKEMLQTQELGVAQGKRNKNLSSVTLTDYRQRQAYDEAPHRFRRLGVEVLRS